MIEEPLPDDWHDLQSSVARIPGEIGLTVEENKLVANPRGSIALDVYAVDTGSVDQSLTLLNIRTGRNALSRRLSIPLRPLWPRPAPISAS
jgi:hypothetical protein